MSNEHETTPSPENVERYLDSIETGHWKVTDYTAEYGRGEPLSLNIEVEWETGIQTYESEKQRRIVKATKEVVGDGEDIEAVLAGVQAECDVSAEDVADVVEMLKRRGEVYQPARGTLRVVDYE